MAKFSFQRNLAFAFILSLGIIYLTFLSFSSPKIFSGFSMQLIFLLDAIKNHSEPLTPLIFSTTFIVNISSGIILSFLLFHFIKSLKYSFTKVLLTKKFIKSLSLQKKEQYNLVKLDKILAFTSGFFNPQIYISSNLIKTVSVGELNAVLFHEQKHQSNFDPLKDFIVDSINRFLPWFPKKEWIFKDYSALVEITCDKHAELKLNSKIHLISALLKINESKSQLDFCLNNFSEFHERVSILINQKKPNFKNFFALNSLLLLVFLFTTTFISKSTIFYQCNHLAQCVEILFTPQNMSLLDHCKN